MFSLCQNFVVIKPNTILLAFAFVISLFFVLGFKFVIDLNLLIYIDNENNEIKSPANISASAVSKFFRLLKPYFKGKMIDIILFTKQTLHKSVLRYFISYKGSPRSGGTFDCITTFTNSQLQCNNGSKISEMIWLIQN